MKKEYIFAKPDRPSWGEAVERAAAILACWPEDSLVNTCQNVPLKYLPQLRAEAEKVNLTLGENPR